MRYLKTPKELNESEKNITLQDVMDDFYEEYETSYIDANTHGVIVKLINELKRSKLLTGDWDELSDRKDEDKDEEVFSNKNGRHPHLTALKSMWNLPIDTLNTILWVNTDGINKEQSIGLANEYIDYMDAVVGTEDPAEAWRDWCISNDIEHEITGNPYL